MSTHSQRIAKRLLNLWKQQDGFCWYCGRPTWLPGAGETKAEARIRLGLTAGVLSAARLFRYRRASIEHLKRRADGGTLKDGTVMACVECNSRRQETPPHEHKQKMRQRLDANP